MWNKLETTYKNNLLILNLFVTFPFFFSSTFPLYFLFFIFSLEFSRSQTKSWSSLVSFKNENFTFFLNVLIWFKQFWCCWTSERFGLYKSHYINRKSRLWNFDFGLPILSLYLEFHARALEFSFWFADSELNNWNSMTYKSVHG